MTQVESLCFTDQIESLPPLRTIVHRILAVTASPNSSAKDVARVLCEDQAVAAKILRVANSPFYGACRRITEVSRAVVILGSTAVKNLVLGLCARDALASGQVPNEEHASLWQHSIAVASACELLARRKNLNPPEEFFVAGLLHDVGRLAMALFQGGMLTSIADAATAYGDTLDLERERFEINHAVAGQRMLQRWGLPDSFCQAAGRHHALEFDPDDTHLTQLAAVVGGDVAAEIVGYGMDLPTILTPRIALASRHLSLSHHDLVYVLTNLRSRVDQAAIMLDEQKRSPAPPMDAEAVRRARWVSSMRRACDELNHTLLQHNAYEIVHGSFADAIEDVRTDDVVFISPTIAERKEAELLARKLVSLGIHKTILLQNPTGKDASRRVDPETRVLYLPEVLTAFDLRWVEQR